MSSQKPYVISKYELHALMLLYSQILDTLSNSKGLKYKESFEFKKTIIKLSNLCKNNINIDDIIVVEGDLDVN